MLNFNIKYCLKGGGLMLNYNNSIYFYFGRLNLICPYTGTVKKDYIEKSINTHEIIEEGDFKWRFFDVKKVSLLGIVIC